MEELDMENLSWDADKENCPSHRSSIPHIGFRIFDSNPPLPGGGRRKLYIFKFENISEVYF